MKQSIFTNSEYIVINELGNGGEATVYKVRHRDYDYVRAVRILNKPILGGKNATDYNKFIDECKLLLRLGNGCNPNIVRIYKPDLVSGHAIVEMDYIDGCNISAYLEKNSFFVEMDEVIRMLNDIGGALAYCHEDIFRYCINRDVDDVMVDPDDAEKILIDDDTKEKLIEKYRVIHNDIHSGNIMRRENGSYVLLDFGLSLDGNCNQRSSKKQGGVPEFKSPEKWDDEGILTTETDIYSFGVLLYEIICGRVPFKLNGNPNSLNALHELGIAHKKDKPEPFFEYRKQAFESVNKGKEYVRDYPDWIEELVMKCLEKKPEDRFKNAKELMNFVAENNKKSYNASIEKEYNNEVSSLKQKIGDLDKELGEVKSEIDVLTEENVELKQKNEVLHQANNNLREQLEMLQEYEIEVIEI